MNINELAELAQSAEILDPIDWGYLNISEDTAYRLMATHVIDLTNNPLTLKATCVKLLVENFVLNLKLEQERARNLHKN
jgi:hypothetical protein|tara:strand:- start:253 stop:489 length:237 start_codon:yes stop_codon:yes gene_type:complete